LRAEAAGMPVEIVKEEIRGELAITSVEEA
jgi:hypothetical protein